MAAMEYAKMARMLTRCAEIAEDANVKSIVKTTYLGILEGPASVYLNAERSVMKAESAHAKEAGEAEAALNALDQPYREARSVVKAFVPTINVPAISTKLAPVLFHHPPAVSLRRQDQLPPFCVNGAFFRHIKQTHDNPLPGQPLRHGPSRSVPRLPNVLNSMFQDERLPERPIQPLQLTSLPFTDSPMKLFPEQWAIPTAPGRRA